MLAIGMCILISSVVFFAWAFMQEDPTCIKARKRRACDKQVKTRFNEREALWIRDCGPAYMDRCFGAAVALKGVWIETA